MKRKVPTSAFVAKAVFVSNTPTVYNTIFSDEALEQITEALNSDNGIPLLVGHATDSLPVGRWHKGENKDGQVTGEFFIPKEEPLHDSLKAKITTHVVDSVSIGFRAAKRTCSICNHGIFSEDCDHIPGKKYGNDTAYMVLGDVKTNEGSLVYDGAVPDAKILMNAGEYSDKKQFSADYAQQFGNDDDTVMHLSIGQITYEAPSGEEKPDKPDGKPDKEEFAEKPENLTSQAFEQKYLQAVNEVARLTTEAASKEAELSDSKRAAKEATEKYAALVQQLTEATEKYAAPFSTTYKAPTNVAQLVADLQLYAAKFSSLPSGQQSVTNNSQQAVAYDDTAYKI